MRVEVDEPCLDQAETHFRAEHAEGAVVNAPLGDAAGYRRLSRRLGWRPPGSGGMRSTSAPARIERTEASPVANISVRPCMFIASVTIRPLKPSSLRSRSVRILGRDGRRDARGFSSGTAICAVMIESTPLAIATRKGLSSVASMRSRGIESLGGRDGCRHRRRRGRENVSR